MMRMMRKMFKRIVSIVMALLVILGTAGYGGSVSAEEAQGQADSASVTFNNDYIYLDPTGMVDSDQDGADWTKSDPSNNKIAYMGIVGKDKLIPADNGNNFNGCWKWKVSDINTAGFKTGNKIYFTYTNNWNDETKGPTIDGHNYYRTEEYKVYGDIAGTVFAQNGAASNPIHNQTVYALKQLTSYAGKTLSVVDMTGSGIGIKALFSTDGSNFDTDKAIVMTDNKVTIPENGVYPYQYVKFIKNNDDTELLASTKIEDAINNGSILYYGVREDSNGIKSVWSKDKKNSSEPTIKKLYFDKNSFGVNDSIQVKIGIGKYENVSADSGDNTILSYDLNGKKLSSDTIIEVKKGDTIYRFYPNGNLSLVTIDGEGNAELGIYRNDNNGTYTVYFDATLSELSYAGDTADNSLPKPKEKVWCFAWNDQGDSHQNKDLELDKEKKGSVYKTDLNEMYDHIVFYSSADVKGDTSLTVEHMREGFTTTSNYTMNLTIPWNLYYNPCFYADTSDDSIYKNVRRSGYWDEVGTVRNADGKTKDGKVGSTVAQQDSCIVDIPKKDYTRKSDTLYVNTTLYDYYSDYELNGYNRDNYKQDNVSINSDRIYQPFRQLDQALSNYYGLFHATNPLYTGNFQNYADDKDAHFSQIAKSLSLFGYDINNDNNNHKFYYENNSMWDSDGIVLGTSQSATQGLVDQQLKDDHLQIKTENGTVPSPYFNENFLNGNNSKNTVLGKVYKNVSFPFSKVHMKSPKGNDATIDYWYFNSAKDENENEISNENKSDIKNWNLRLQQDSSGKYYLMPHDNADTNLVKGRTTESATGGGNYFPFNDGNDNTQSGNASRLNYGFGQRFDLKFKLTDNGKVTDSKGKDVPIEFKFSGDDDVWVFIDGQLVLDVGGDHGAVSGTINFDEKKATVYGVKNSNNGGRVDHTVNYFSNILPNADNTKEHTLTMFYMERGLWESNMKITFNFPDENEFQVEKNVDTTAVADDFKSCFDNVSAFPFTILNQATHYGTVKATGVQKNENKTFNNEFKDGTISKVLDTNTFEYLATCKDESGDGTEKSDVVHWKAEYSDDDGTHKDLRWGIIYPSSENGKEFDATYKMSNGTANHYKYLQFSLYDGDTTETPALNNMYVELEDSSSNTIGGFLSADNIYNSLNLKKGKWNTITIDLDKLTRSNVSFDYSKIANIKFDYNLSRDMYLDDFTFIPSTEVTQPTGFVTKQYAIPDYGSATSGTLMYPVNAVYTVSSGASSTTYLLGTDGTFTLANGETATFVDQFRQGSYIALSEDVDTEAFEPSWTLYENGEAVKSTVPANSKTVTQAETVELPTQAGQTIRDGRKENYVNGKDSDDKEQSNDGYTETGWAKKNGTKSYDDDRDEKNTIVFRSFTEPDNSTIVTKLKVKYTNKVKTGTIRIAKAAAYDKDKDKVTGINGNQYQFTVEFSNIAGMALETTKITKTYTGICGGEPIEISGIPAGTVYRITEIKPTDGSTLAGIDIQCPKYTGDDAKYIPTLTEDKSAVVGIVKADSDISADQPQTLFTFKNTKKPLMDLKVIKVWDKQNKDPELPQSIKVKLQRHNESDSTNHWEDVTFSTDNNSSYTEIKPNPYNNEWTYTFKNLECYVDYTIQSPVKWQYRVVELNQAGDTVLSKDDYFNNYFKLSSYSDAVSYDADKTDENKFTITNVYSPKTNIKITKVDASDEKVKLNDVEFKLEKLTAASGTDSNFVVDNKFDPIIVTTSGAEDAAGIAEFRNLPDGTYRLTETKAKEGYSLLKDPITIIIDRTGTTSVDNENYTFGTDEDTKNTISLQISNRRKFLLPKTGGYGAMLLILCGMALVTLGCLIFFLINLRKEVQYSRLKRQRRNAIGK